MLVLPQARPWDNGAGFERTGLGQLVSEKLPGGCPTGSSGRRAGRSKVKGNCVGKDRKPPAVSSANKSEYRQMQFRRRSTPIPRSGSGPEMIKAGALGKRSASHVLTVKEASRLDSRSGKSK